MLKRGLVLMFAVAFVFGCGPKQTASLDSGRDWSVQLYLPEGPGPFPVAVFLPGCEGWSSSEVRASGSAHRAALIEAGWGVAQLDVLGPRGIASICSNLRLLEDLRDDSVQAASAAAAELADNPRVDGTRLVFIGQSFGGSVALDIASANQRQASPRIFEAVVAYYPYCYARYGVERAADFDTPVLVLTGANDTWTPASRCQALEQDQSVQAGATTFTVEVFPGAYHSFDLDHMPRYEIQGVNGTEIVQGNATQAAASRRFYLQWLATVLGDDS